MTLYFDTETTGLPIRHPVFGKMYDAYQLPNAYKGVNVVEFGYILESEDGEVLDTGDWIIPEYVDKIQPAALAVNGITKEVADRHETCCSAQELLTMLDSLPFSRVVGHNINFDVELMRNECRLLGFDELADRFKRATRVCTQELSRDYQVKHKGWKKPRGSKFSDPRAMSLTELYGDLFGRQFEKAHRALNDTKATKECHDRFVELGLIQRPTPVARPLPKPVAKPLPKPAPKPQKKPKLDYDEEIFD